MRPWNPLHILFTSQPASGHLRPLVPIAHAAQRRGHRVTVCAAERLRGEVCSYGLDFQSAGYDWTPEVLSLLPASYFWMPFAEAADALASIEDALIDMYVGDVAVATARSILDALCDAPVDLVIRELDEYGGYLAAETWGVPHISVASFGGPHVAQQHRVGPLLSNSRRQLGLAPDLDAERLYHFDHISFLPPEYGADELVLPNTRCYRHSSSERLRERLPRWMAELDTARPTVFAGFGTVVYDLPGADGFVRTVIEALGGIDCSAVVAVGSGREPNAYHAPPNVHLASFVPQPLMLESCDLFVTHGGLNSIKETLHVGVPMVGVPVLKDHRHNLVSCLRLGVACVVPAADVSVPMLRAAFEQVLGDPVYRRRARDIQRRFHMLPSVDDLVSDLEQMALDKR